MTKALAYLDADSDVFRYAWFSGRSTEIPTSNLMASSTEQLTILGSQYTSSYQSSAVSALTEDSTAQASQTPVAPWIIGVSVILVILAAIVIAVVAIKKKEPVSEIV